MNDDNSNLELTAEEQAALERDGELEEKTDRLITLANQAGGEDNITVLLVSIQRGATDGFWQRFQQRWFLKAS